ncbi:MAG: DUF2499 domain-containing protein [Leptolyngbyaceae cyanobacterium SM1_1_3]|nr:DUF2499 domain-containing protein [Leptolyngbyaceae cyanobacterium SM1_1_3]NJM85232.1 DUF2499 domain-containing protein [Leptolyngbyaceae cyanobacterium RM2_2_21]NJN04519.1 DUF2499 domain-containing protein [Leptolyngbyaceae cyanobacterium RM1_1_2]NJO08393.1 DUF2499 domain-containing protein [Leptolyngbyaceae cyanobacterium SL_1_1]
MHALSIPTWMVHISSVIEWIAAIWFVWRYAEVSDRSAWRYLAFAMLPALVSAMCACTWHFFDNAESLDWLVTLQAAMTVVSNVAFCAAAWWIWRCAKIPSKSISEEV